MGILKPRKELITLIKLIEEPCPHCKGKGVLKTGYDTEQIICLTCGIKTIIEIGNYYDEGFMDGTYVKNYWINGNVGFNSKILKV